MKAIFTLLTAAALATPAFADHHGEKGTKWTSLFDGKSLTGWSQKNGTATYVVKDGTIVGTTAKGSPNSFLCTDKHYGDFELQFDVKVDNQLNSGVQFRAAEKDGKTDGTGRVYGPQCEIEATNIKGGGEAGYIYGEATGRGWLVSNDKRTPHKHFKDGEWNHFRIVAKGAHIQTWINGQLVCDLTDEAIFKSHPKGFIGLQVHGVGKRGPFSVAWKNIKIKEL
ncbi:hypothetical protein NT6N_19550 [Oceaniferula spumae]|uniref:3-keto-alpha-glucoside-1,2-lyase/3-keto-2-hydroxy-glucal hydratase domain-containing protein n=1 Tax=Oceaniferula spumae TaxID=2979115 RepID=A0AAT9FLR7_9BACT